MADSDIMEYKSNIMTKLIELPDLLTLINNKDIIYPIDLINTNLFSRMRIPNTTMTVKNYICFNCSSRILKSNTVFKSVTINIGIVCHEDDISTELGNRHDVLCGVVLEAFNWSNFLGFELELVSDIEGILENNYQTRTLQFQNLAPNSLSNGVKMDGY